MKEKAERRLIGLVVQESAVLDVMRASLSGHEELVLPRIPLVPCDACIRAVHYDYTRAAFVFVLYHDSFDIVDGGKPFPLVEVDLWGGERVYRTRKSVPQPPPPPPNETIYGGRP